MNCTFSNVAYLIPVTEIMSNETGFPSQDVLSTSGHHSQARSCNECRRRKIKCDRNQPCSYCSKVRVQCIFTAAVNQTPNTRVNFETDVQSRLQRLESSLERIERMLSSMTAKDGLRSNDSHECNQSEVNEAAMNNTRDQDHSLDHFSSQISSNSSNYDNQAQSLLFGTSSSIDLKKFHPSPSQHQILWQVYLDNVDPVLKVFHAPTVQRQMLINPIEPAFESLLFAIYYAAVISISCSEQYKNILEEDKPTLLAKYRYAIEQSLVKTDFLRTPTLMLLQAFTIYLISSRRDSQSPSTWTLTAIAIRLATKLGINQDPKNLDISFFEKEMRRRLWWQICILDVRSAEDNDMQPAINEHDYDTLFPANINDSDLDPSMVYPISEAPGRSDMLFTLVRFEISSAFRQIVFSNKFNLNNGYPILTAAGKNQFIDDLNQKLEEKYFKHCDTRIPICFLSITASRLILAKTKLLIHYSYKQCDQLLPTSRKDELFKTSIEIVEYASTLRSSPHYGRWVWLFQRYIEWDATAYVLYSIISNPQHTLCNRAWEVVETFFKGWEGYFQDTERGTRWQQLELLKTKADKACNRTFEVDGTSLEDGPQDLTVPVSHNGKLNDLPISMQGYTIDSANTSAKELGEWNFQDSEPMMSDLLMSDILFNENRSESWL